MRWLLSWALPPRQPLKHAQPSQVSLPKWLSIGFRWEETGQLACNGWTWCRVICGDLTTTLTDSDLEHLKLQSSDCLKTLLKSELRANQMPHSRMIKKETFIMACFNSLSILGIDMHQPLQGKFLQPGAMKFTGVRHLQPEVQSGYDCSSRKWP